MVKTLKKLKKSSSPEAIDWWPCNLVCSIVYASTTKIVQIVTLGWTWPILRKGQIWLHRLLYGRKWIFFFLGGGGGGGGETIAALGLKLLEAFC